MLLREITSLLGVPEGDGPHASVPVARMEHVLTSGYAHALSLEAERVRLERRLGEAVRRFGHDQSARDEISELSARISSAEGDLSRLRPLLVALRDRARAARRAA